ncbi:MAG: IS1595 family transposase [Gallionellaceae bacterium]
MKSQTVQQFFKQFPDDTTCLDHIMRTRYGMEGECPKCNKPSRFSRVSSQRAYACQWCGNHLYPCVGSPFEKSRTSLQLWFFAIYLFTQTRSGVSAKELERQLGVTYKCAWRMGHEIRKHMAAVDGNEPLSGEVEVDETYVGGVRKGKRGRGAGGKTIVMGMLQKDGDVMTKIVPNVRRNTLQPIIEDNVEQGTEIHTDELRSYRGLGDKGYTHKTVNHGKGEYVKGTTTVNNIEAFWSRLKQSIGGTHVHVSGKHLYKYTGEFEYRFNARNHPEKMLSELLSTFPPSKKE